MPRFTCESCATSLYSAARPGSLNDPSCPTCGTPLDQRELLPGFDSGAGPIPAAVSATTRLELHQ
jgi:hypothetical protein